MDDPRTTERRRQIIGQKVFLRRIYEDWYAGIVSSLPAEEGPVLEIGSGPGFLKDFIPKAITSEVFYCSHVNVVMDGCQIPFAEDALQAIVMIDVLHHLSKPRSFFREATRCIRPGGVLAMVEPWVTPWSRWVYRRLHHEPFRPDAEDWEFSQEGEGGLSGANIALPWILFQRDRAQFVLEFPQWQIRALKLMMPFRYIVSGGVSLRSVQPGWSYALWSHLEQMLRPFMAKLAMFAQIVLQKAR